MSSESGASISACHSSPTPRSSGGKPGLPSPRRSPRHATATDDRATSPATRAIMGTIGETNNAGSPIAIDKPWIVPQSGLRSREVILSELPDGHRFPDDMPQGPFGFGQEGFDVAFNVLFGYWSQRGAKIIKAKGITKATLRSRKGARTTFACERYGHAPAEKASPKRNTTSKKTNCPFYLSLEESNDGVVVARINIEACDLDTFHNHSLSFGGKQNVPTDLEPLGAAMAAANLKPSQIFMVLSHQVQSRNEPVLFTREDIRNKWASTPSEKKLDATGMISDLKRREATSGLFYDFVVDEDEGLTRVFFEMKGGKALWKNRWSSSYR